MFAHGAEYAKAAPERRVSFLISPVSFFFDFTRQIAMLP